MIAIAGVSALYFTKFLGRADRHHLEQSFSVTVPLLFYLGYRAITFAEASIASAARARDVVWAPRRDTLRSRSLLRCSWRLPPGATP